MIVIVSPTKIATVTDSSIRVHITNCFSIWFVNVSIMIYMAQSQLHLIFKQSSYSKK